MANYYSDRVSSHVEKIIKELKPSHPLDFDDVFNHFEWLSIVYDSKNENLAFASDEEKAIGLHSSTTLKGKGDEHIIHVSWKKEEETLAQRFKIARELGHIFMGHLIYDPVGYDRSKNALIAEADAFAANLLMPEEEFRKRVDNAELPDGRVDIKKVAEFFRVEPRVAYHHGCWLLVFLPKD